MVTDEFSLLEPQSASPSKFKFEPKGNEIISSWRRVRVNYEPGHLLQYLCYYFVILK